MGSTLALTDSTGTLQTTYTFDPFGNTSLNGSPTTNSFAYTGRELDATGLFFYRARYYNSALQRFISEDPLGFSANSVNFYEYVVDRPTMYNDPSGMQFMDPDKTGGKDLPPVEALPPSTEPPAPDLGRWPDYLNANLSIGPVSLSFGCDMYEKCYGGIGPNKGTSFPKIGSANISLGWLNQTDKPSSEQVCKFMTQNNFSAGGGFGIGGGETYTPGSGTSSEFGIYTPQAGGSYHRSWKLGGRQSCY